MADSSLPPDVLAALEGAVREPPAPVPQGERVAGRYVKTEKLGAGGMGEVWKAWDLQLGRWVALKFLRDDVGVDAERFAREAQLAAKLNHPNIATVYDAGTTAEGRRYMSMQLIVGQTLQQMSRADRRLLIELVRDAALAVHYAHGQGVIHRDLKPANLMVEMAEGARPRVFVMDFGLAKQTETESSLSVSGVALGTPAYMSPEQARGGHIDPRADVWGLGATLSDLLVGRPPFRGSPAEILAKILEATPVPVRRIDPDIPLDLETIVMHCLEKDPGRRYASAQELAADLTRYLEGESIQARPPSPMRRAWLWVRRRAVLSAAVAAVLLTLLAVGGTWYVTPGTINLAVQPAGARITIGSGSWTSPGEAALAAGAYAVRIEADEHEPETREVVVERGRTKDLTVALRHHQGLLEADAAPAGAEIEVDGVAYGSRVRNLALDTGRHRVRAWARGCFDQERVVTIRRGETTRVRLSLDEGVAWREFDSNNFGGVAVIPDLDGDGAPDFASITPTSLILRSGRESTVLWEIPGSPGRSWNWLLQGRSIVMAADEVTGLVVWCVRLGARGAFEESWRWEGPRRSWSKPAHATWSVLPETGGAWRVAVAGRDGMLHVIDGTTGRPRGAAASLGMRILQIGAAESGLAFCGRPGVTEELPDGGRAVCGTIREGDAKPLWTVEVDDVDSITLISMTPRFFWIGRRRWGFVDGSSRKIIDLGPYADGAEKVDYSGAMTIDGDSELDLVVLAGGQLSARKGADGSLMWRASVADLGGPDPHTTVVQRMGRQTFVALRDGVAEIDVVTGRRVWELRGTIRGTLASDWDGDGVCEVFVGIEGEGLRCLASDGRTLWKLRLEHYAHPTAVLPDVDGDGLAEVVVSAFAAWSGVVRGPKILWRLQETPPIQATPAVADGSVYLLSHVSGTPRRARVVCVESATGSPRWDVEIPASRTRAPAVADWDGDGRVDVAHSGASPSEREFIMTVLRGSDGSSLAGFKELTAEAVDSYTVPLVVDVNGDGVRDFVTSRWHTHDVWCVDGRRNEVMWRHKTKLTNMGGLAAADLDGDGMADVVAPSIDGNVYGLRGRDGFVIWSTPVGTNGSRSLPALYDLTGDDTQDVLVVTVEGRLCVIDGRTGAMLWNQVRSTEGLGRPSVARAGGRTLIVAPMGVGGVVALDWEKRELIWNGPPGRHVIASPAIADLDGDGTLEVVICAMRADPSNKIAESELVVADLLSGRPLWRVPVGKREVEADPVVVDLDGDGCRDILVATYEGVLYAVSGRGTVGARRRGR